jgi:catechol 2,3-dioxygenase-like lactoylglutathione lyase family enzyme
MVKFISTLITVSDIKKSRDFYQNVLGQKVKYDFGENITFDGGFAIHERAHFKKLIDNKEIKVGGNNFELYFEHDDVSGIEKKLIENNITFVHKTREQPWRQRVIRFYDLDRNIIEVGESMEFLSYRLFREGNSMDEIAKTIQMTTDFVKAAIQKIDIKQYNGRVPACGCFCGGCPNYTREKKPCPGADTNRERCERCTTFHLCCSNKGITHCFECSEFPCRKFKSWTKRWEKYGQNFIDNQNLLKTEGEKGFLAHYNSKTLTRE